MCRPAGFRTSVPAVGAAPGEGAFGGLQPLQELQLPGQTLRPVRARRRRLGGQRRDIGQSPCGERVLVALVRGAVADAPGPPAAAPRGRAAPGVVPRQQIVLGVTAGRGRAGVGIRATADPLEVLVEHGIAEVVTHLGGLGHRRRDLTLLALGGGPAVRPVGGLYRTGVGVRGVGVLPLLGIARVVDEQIEKAVRTAVVEEIGGRLRDGLPHRLLRPALIGVDERRSGSRSRLTAGARFVAVAVGVVQVHQPVHAVDVHRAVGRGQFRGDGIRADRDRTVQGGRVVVGQRPFGRVGRRGARVVRVGGGLIRVLRDDGALRDRPGFVEGGPVPCHPAVRGLQPHPETDGLGGRLVTVVRRFDHQRLGRVVRKTVRAEVAVARRLDLAVLGEERLGVRVVGRRGTGAFARRSGGLGHGGALGQAHRDQAAAQRSTECST